LIVPENNAKTRGIFMVQDIFGFRNRPASRSREEKVIILVKIQTNTTLN